MERGWVTIDHVEEHTIQMALDEGFWAGINHTRTQRGGSGSRV